MVNLTDSDQKIDPSQPQPMLRLIPPPATRTPWKNGLGETLEIAIFPEGKDFKKDEFQWRFSLSEAHDTCNFSVFPGYDISVMVLPNDDLPLMDDPYHITSNYHQSETSTHQNHNNNGTNYRNANARNYHDNQMDNEKTHIPLFSKKGTGNISPKLVPSAPFAPEDTAFLHHNDHESSAPLKPLIPYSYKGEWPTSCKIHHAPLRHLTFLCQRKTATSSFHFETISYDNDDILAEGRDIGDECDESVRKAVSRGASSLSGRSQLDSNNKNSSDEQDSKKSPPFHRLLLGATTIIHVVNGSISASINAFASSVQVEKGNTLIIERSQEDSPTELGIKPLSDQEEETTPNDSQDIASKTGGLGVGHLNSDGDTSKFLLFYYFVVFFLFSL